MDLQLSLDLLAEEFAAAERLAQALGLTLRRGDADHPLDVYVPYLAPDGEAFLLRIRCDGYDERPPSFQWVNPANPDEEGPQWWPRMPQVPYARGDRGEIVFCTIGTREYHQHSSHRAESHAKEVWELSRLVKLAWQYLCQNGPYAGRGVG